MSRRRRHELTDAQWDKVKDLLPGKASDPGRTPLVSGCGPSTF